MAKVDVFNLVSLDGYFAGVNGDISWHNTAGDFQEYAERMASSGSTLLFGRVTYELMASYWRSAEAQRNDPKVTQGMNNSPKIVFSRTLNRVAWENTELVSGDLLEAVRKLKAQSERDLTILGSGSIVAQLEQAGLIDTYHFLLSPVVLGGGKTLFDGLKGPRAFRLQTIQTFRNGNILLGYEPKKE